MSDEKLLKSAKRRKLKQREYYLRNKYKDGKYYKLEQQLTQKDKQIELLLGCVGYVKASHRCICGNDKKIPCSRCEVDITLEKYKEIAL